VENWTATKKANGFWLFEWDGDSGDSFDIWLDGVLLETVTGGEYECVEPDYDEAPPPLEIVADDSYTFAENDLYPPFAYIQWRGVLGCAGYVVEKLVGATWVTQDVIAENLKGWYYYRTAVLEDGGSYYYRVVATTLGGSEGTPVDFIVDIVRNPSPPSVSFSIESNGLVAAEVS